MSSRKRTSLNGVWKFSTPGSACTDIAVPSSVRCVGISKFEKLFRFEKSGGRRYILTFEGINYEGRITLNGKYLGTTLPYCHFSFDITNILRDENILVADTDDINAPYGPTDGWNNYGGIIRSVYIDEVPPVYIENIYVRTRLSPDFSEAQADIIPSVSGNADGIRVIYSVSFGGETIAVSDGTVTVRKPRLWSPDSPELYRLTVTLEKDGTAVDTFEQNIGFKSLVHDGKRFYLNGREFFILGVCRHDLGSLEKGHTLSDGDIEKDLIMIKQLGCNFVRLVHYPHDKRVIDMCDRIGLLVSEESGLWWSDLTKPELAEGAIEVLRRTLLRDRNNVSVAFWMGFNECVFTQEFLDRSARVCRELDPDRYVSGANCMSPEMTVPMFDRAGIDFYTFHPYGSGVYSVTSGTNSPKGGTSTLNRIIDAFSGKPLVFTEWGGWNVVGNPALFSQFCEKMKSAMRQGKLAGMIYWAFADMYELNRDPDADVDGVQIEGLVTVDRRPKVCYYVLRDFIKSLNDPEPVKCEMTVTGSCGCENILTRAVNLPEQENYATIFSALIADGKAMGGRFRHRAMRRTEYGPVLPRPVGRIGAADFGKRTEPVIVSRDAPEYTADVGTRCEKLLILGGVAFSQAYPFAGAFGEKRGEIVIRFADGTDAVMPIRNGIELLSAATTFGSSFIDPRSPVMSPAVTFSYDKNFENYRIYVLPIEIGGRDVASVTFRVREDFNYLVYGVCAVK